MMTTVARYADCEVSWRYCNMIRETVNWWILGPTLIFMLGLAFVKATGG
jgi:hypothetical protein